MIFCFRYFSEGLRMVENFGGYVEDLSAKLVHIASDQEKERRELVDITNTLKNSPGFNKVVSSLSQSKKSPVNSIIPFLAFFSHQCLSS